mgnify:CR=1 FL=1|jgi:hypothetical protein
MNKNTGFYMDTAPKVLLFGDNQVITAFRDSAVFQDDKGFHTERQMLVEGKSFYVKSFFPSAPKATPANQLIKLIDNDAKIR